MHRAALRKQDSMPDASNLALWRAAVEHFVRSKKVTRALASILVRYGAWCTSSCSVERNFFKAQWAVEGRKAWLSEQRYNDELKVLCDVGDECAPELVPEARKLWIAMLYGDVRKAQEGRLARGVLQGKGIKRTLKGFIKTRRAHVSAMLEDVGVRQETERTVKRMKAPGKLSESMKKEVTFQKAKRMSYLVDALASGHVDVESLDAATIDVVLQEMKRREKAAARSLQERRRKDRALQPPSKPTLQNKAVFVEPDVNLGPSELQRSATAHGWRTVADRTMANVFVVRTPADPGQRTGWVVALRGGVVTTSEYLLNDGQLGAAIAFKQATKNRKWVYLDDSFMTAHPTVSQLLIVCGTQRESKWIFLQSRDEVQRIHANLSGKGRDNMLLVFVSKRISENLPPALS